MTESPMKAGWLRNTFWLVEAAVGGNRWAWWSEAASEGVAEDIPQMNFNMGNSAISEGTKHLVDLCLKTHRPATDLLEWILWSLGDPVWGRNYPQQVDERTHRYWYHHLDLGILLRTHTDHISFFLCEMGSKSSQQGLGYFPTPPGITQVLEQLTFGDDDVDIMASVHDPCVGCGAMFLPISNRSLNISGIDVAYQCILGCTLNAWLFVPWLIPCNATINGVEWNKPRIIFGNALSLEVRSLPQDGWDTKPAPSKPTATPSELKEQKQQRKKYWENHPAVERVAKDVLGYIGFRKDVASFTQSLEDFGDASD